MNRQKTAILGIIVIVSLFTVLSEPLEASKEMRVLGVADASLYFVDERNLNVVINYTSYRVSGSALAVIFDNETLREYFRNRLVTYVKEKCAEAGEPKGTSTIRFNADVEPRVDFIKGPNWSRISISFNMTGEGEPVLGKAGEYWAHYEFRGGFLQLIRGGVLQWVTILRPPLPLVLVDVLKLTVTLPKGYSAIQVVPRQSSIYVDWKEDRLTLIWLFRDPSIERRDPSVAGIKDLFLDIKSIGDDEKKILETLENLENKLRKDLPYALDKERGLKLLEKVSIAKYEERAFQILSNKYLEELISEAEWFLRKAGLFKLFIASLPLLSLLLSIFIFYKEARQKYFRKLFGKIPRLTK